MLRTLLLFQKKTFKNFSYKDNNNSRTGERERMKNALGSNTHVKEYWKTLGLSASLCERMRSRFLLISNRRRRTFSASLDFSFFFTWHSDRWPVSNVHTREILQYIKNIINNKQERFFSPNKGNIPIENAYISHQNDVIWSALRTLQKNWLCFISLCCRPEQRTRTTTTKTDLFIISEG